VKHRVFLGRTGDQVAALKDTLSRALVFAGVTLPIGRPVVVKPNMTWTSWKPGVTTTPALMEALAELLVDHGDRVTFVESDGGMASWKAEEALYAHGCFDLARRHPGKVFARSLMHEPRRVVPVDVLGTRVAIPLPESLLDPDKFFVTIPTLKTHCMTTISLNFKNQWGCIPDVKRLRHHHMLGPAIVGICRLIGLDLSIVDALTALDGNGPMYGVPVPFGALILGRDAGAVARVGARVMGIDHRRAPDLRVADRLGLVPRDEAIETSSPIDEYRTHDFRTVVLPKNLISIALAKSAWATWLVYDSPATPVIYGVRRKIFGHKGIPRTPAPDWVYDYSCMAGGGGERQ
jgi:uncharacterized protein (DUF362 family)